MLLKGITARWAIFCFGVSYFSSAFCAVSAIGAIAQAIALKHYTAEGDPRDVAGEELRANHCSRSRRGGGKAGSRR